MRVWCNSFPVICLSCVQCKRWRSLHHRHQVGCKRYWPRRPNCKKMRSSCLKWRSLAKRPTSQWLLNGLAKTLLYDTGKLRAKLLRTKVKLWNRLAGTHQLTASRLLRGSLLTRQTSQRPQRLMIVPQARVSDGGSCVFFVHSGSHLVLVSTCWKVITISSHVLTRTALFWSLAGQLWHLWPPHPLPPANVLFRPIRCLWLCVGQVVLRDFDWVDVIVFWNFQHISHWHIFPKTFHRHLAGSCVGAAC